MDHPIGATNWGSPAKGITTFTAPAGLAVESASLGAATNQEGVGGSTAATEAQRQTAYNDAFSDPDIEDVSVIIAGPASVDNGGATNSWCVYTDLVAEKKRLCWYYFT